MFFIYTAFVQHYLNGTVSADLLFSSLIFFSHKTHCLINDWKICILAADCNLDSPFEYAFSIFRERNGYANGNGNGY